MNARQGRWLARRRAEKRLRLRRSRARSTSRPRSPSSAPRPRIISTRPSSGSRIIEAASLRPPAPSLRYAERKVALHGALGEEKAGRDRSVGVPRDRQPEHLALPVGEVEGIDAVAQHRGNDAESGGDGAHGRDQRCSPARPRAQGSWPRRGGHGVLRAGRTPARRLQRAPAGLVQRRAQMPQRDGVARDRSAITRMSGAKLWIPIEHRMAPASSVPTMRSRSAPEAKTCTSRSGCHAHRTLDGAGTSATLDFVVV